MSRSYEQRHIIQTFCRILTPEDSCDLELPGGCLRQVDLDHIADGSGLLVTESIHIVVPEGVLSKANVATAMAVAVMDKWESSHQRGQRLPKSPRLRAAVAQK
jgi:hypothetical protein